MSQYHYEVQKGCTKGREGKAMIWGAFCQGRYVACPVVTVWKDSQRPVVGLGHIQPDQR